MIILISRKWCFLVLCLVLCLVQCLVLFNVLYLENFLELGLALIPEPCRLGSTEETVIALTTDVPRGQRMTFLTLTSGSDYHKCQYILRTDPTIFLFLVRIEGAPIAVLSIIEREQSMILLALVRDKAIAIL